MKLLYLLPLWQVLMYCTGCTTPAANPPPVGPNLNGIDWKGQYFSTDGSIHERLTARVEHKAELLHLTTSRGEQPARLFMGTVNEKGDVYAIDASDGRRWTSYFGPASKHNLKLAVFIRVPEAGKPDPPMLVLDLYR